MRIIDKHLVVVHLKEDDSLPLILKHIKKYKPIIVITHYGVIWKKSRKTKGYNFMKIDEIKSMSWLQTISIIDILPISYLYALDSDNTNTLTYYLSNNAYYQYHVGRRYGGSMPRHIIKIIEPSLVNVSDRTLSAHQLKKNIIEQMSLMQKCRIILFVFYKQMLLLITLLMLVWFYQTDQRKVNTVAVKEIKIFNPLMVVDQVKKSLPEYYRYNLKNIIISSLDNHAYLEINFGYEEDMRLFTNNLQNICNCNLNWIDANRLKMQFHGYDTVKYHDIKQEIKLTGTGKQIILAHQKQKSRNCNIIYLKITTTPAVEWFNTFMQYNCSSDNT